MPVALEPDQKFRSVLTRDEKKPLEKRPYFLFEYINCRLCRKVAIDHDNLIANSKDSNEVIDNLLGIVKRHLVGWGNMIEPSTGAEIPFNPDDLEVIIGVSEAHELVNGLLNQSVSPDDLKNLESPSVSSTGKSARRVRARKGAKTNRRR